MPTNPSYGVQLRQITDLLLFAKECSRKGNTEGLHKYANLAEQYMHEYVQQLENVCQRVNDGTFYTTRKTKVIPEIEE